MQEAGTFTGKRKPKKGKIQPKGSSPLFQLAQYGVRSDANKELNRLTKEKFDRGISEPDPDALPQSQDGGLTQVLGDTASRVPCVPAFQRCTDGCLARSTEDDSGADRPLAHRIVHVGRTVENLIGNRIERLQG